MAVYRGHYKISIALIVHSLNPSLITRLIGRCSLPRPIHSFYPIRSVEHYYTPSRIVSHGLRISISVRFRNQQAKHLRSITFAPGSDRIFFRADGVLGITRMLV